MFIASSVQFSSRWYLCAQKSPYVLHPICQKFPAGRDLRGEVNMLIASSVQLSSVQKGIYALRKAHMCSTLSQKFPAGGDLVVQFSSKWYLCTEKSPRVHRPVSQKFSAGGDLVGHSEVWWTGSLLLMYSSVQFKIVCAL